MWQKRGVTFWEDGLWLPRIEGIFCAMTFLLNVFFFFFDSSRRTGLTRHVTPNVLAIRILKDGVNLVTFFPQFEQLISAVVLWVCPAQLGSVFLLCFFFFSYHHLFIFVVQKTAFLQNMRCHVLVSVFDVCVFVFIVVLFFSAFLIAERQPSKCSRSSPCAHLDAGL